MLNPAAIQHANVVLRDLDGVFSGDDSYQKFKWLWSSDLWSLVPILDANGEQQMQFTCSCGVDRKVHSVNCTGITEANVLMEKCYMTEDYGPLASYRNMWVLCRWVPPPSIEEWKSSMGTAEDYPAHGRYLPVDKDGITIVIPPRARPEEYTAIARLIVQKFTAHHEAYVAAQKLPVEHKRELPRMDKRGNIIEPPHKDAKFWQVRDRIKATRPTFDLTATTGAGGKTGRGHTGQKPNVHYSTSSLADPNGPLAREMQKPVDALREAQKELINGNRND